LAAIKTGKSFRKKNKTFGRSVIHPLLHRALLVSSYTVNSTCMQRLSACTKFILRAGSTGLDIG
jgi:hypothetical protein